MLLEVGFYLGLFRGAEENKWFSCDTEIRTQDPHTEWKTRDISVPFLTAITWNISKHSGSQKATFFHKVRSLFIRSRGKFLSPLPGSSTDERRWEWKHQVHTSVHLPSSNKSTPASVQVKSPAKGGSERGGRVCLPCPKPSPPTLHPPANLHGTPQATQGTVWRLCLIWRKT